MGRASRLLPCALALVLAVGCQDDAPLPSDPDAVELAGKGTCPAAELIDDLFPKGLANAATQRCRNIQRQFARGHEDNAFNKLEKLVAFIQQHLENGRLDDPDGSGPETDASGAAALIVQLHAMVGLADGSEEIPSEAFTAEGGTVQTLDAQETWDVETRDGFAGITKAAGVPVFLNGQPYEGPVTLFIAPIEPSASGFPGFGLQVGGSDRAAFPLFKDIGTIPAGLTFGDGNIGETADPGNELVVELCIVDPPHTLAPLGSQLPDLRIGHIHEGEVQAAPLRSSTLDCSGVNDEVPTVALLENRWHRWANVALGPLASLFDVARLYANPGRLGGAISAFSEFGGVDRTKVAPDPGFVSDPLVITMTWDAVSDQDLHLLRGADTRFYDDLNDCFFANCIVDSGFYTIDWGPEGPAGNPELNTDVLRGTGPEIIELDGVETDVIYRAGTGGLPRDVALTATIEFRDQRIVCQHLTTDLDGDGRGDAFVFAIIDPSAGEDAARCIEPFTLTITSIEPAVIEVPESGTTRGTFLIQGENLDNSIASIVSTRDPISLLAPPRISTDGTRAELDFEIAAGAETGDFSVGLFGTHGADRVSVTVVSPPPPLMP